MKRYRHNTVRTHLGQSLPCLFLLVSGCTTALSTMQPADTLARGQWHVGGGMSVSLPVTQVIDSLDKVNTLKDKYIDNPDYVPTDEDQRDFLDAAIGLALNAPGPTTDVMVRYGVGKGLDLGLRWTTTGIHADAKAQFFRTDSGWAGSVSAGYAHHAFEGLIFDVLEQLNVDDFSRWDIEVPVLIGKRLGKWGQFWCGPKYVFARYHLDAKVENAAKTITSEGNIHYVGGLAGFGVGYRWLYAFAELTAMDMLARPTILDKEIDIGGLVIVPAAGLMARW